MAIEKLIDSSPPLAIPSSPGSPVRAARHGLETGKAMKYWNRQQPQHRQCHFLLLAAARLEARLEASMGFLATLMLNFKQLHVAQLI